MRDNRKDRDIRDLNKKLLDDLSQRGIKIDDEEYQKRRAEKEKELQDQINKACDQQSKKDMENAFANMPLNSRKLTLNFAKNNWDAHEMPVIDKAIDAVMNFDHRDKGLYMYSKNSRTGKTAVMGAIARGLYKEMRKSIWFGSEDQFLSELKGIYNQKYESQDSTESQEEKFIKFVASHDAVFLDELGQNDSDWAIKTIKRLLDAIFNSGAKLFITSNYSIDDLGKKLLINQKKPMSRTVPQVQARLDALTEPLKFGEKSY